jgi:hypothetical protein
MVWIEARQKHYLNKYMAKEKKRKRRTLEEVLREARTRYSEEPQGVRTLLVNRMEELLGATKFVANRPLSEKEEEVIKSFLKIVIDG